VTEFGFAAMTRSMRQVCRELEVPVGGVLEGGYSLGALARSVLATLAALSGAVDGQVDPFATDTPQAVAARERLGARWPALAALG
jgi:acetoin utilization deacetylase AcuC-like enzyme